MSKLVCNFCKSDWKSEGNPSTCQDCQKDSFAIAVEGVANPIARRPDFRIDGSRFAIYGNSTPTSVGIAHNATEN